MTNLSGRSIVLLKVPPEQLENAFSEISRMPNVTNVWPVLGSYDLLVSAGFSEYIGLRDFVEEMKSKQYCKECKVHPNFMEWERKESKDAPVKGWIFIDSTDFKSTFEGLKKMDNVQWVISTSGDCNMVAGISVSGFREYGDVIRRNVLTLPGIRKTETYTHTPEYGPM